jgi:DNA helicase-2/ATP-dependent DNA helicase PcrA
VGFHAYADDAAEAEGIATRIAALIAAGTAPREIAVLYRTNSQSEAFEEALATHGIGYLVRGGQRFFDREEVRRAMVLLRGAAVAPSEDPLGQRVREVVVDIGWAEEPPAARGAVRERWDSLQALVELADDVDSTARTATGEGASMRDFVEHLAERAAAQHAPAVEGVTLTTMHAAKGLEWDAVFIAGLSEGLVPISLAETDEALEEERRLLYVAVTRAREHLSLSFARSRTEGGRASRKRTRFLEKWWPDARPPRQQRVSASASDLTASELELFERLKSWRLDHAKASDRPAFTVLVDSTLAAIARERPASLRELAAIHGIGASKLDAYGTEIIALIAGNPVAPQPHSG